MSLAIRTPRHAVFLVLCAGISIVISREAPSGVDSDGIYKFAKNYQDTTSPEQRLKIAVSAVNQGIIHEGCSVSDVDHLFGTRYVRRVPHMERDARTDVGKIEFGQSSQALKDQLRALEEDARRNPNEELTSPFPINFPTGWHLWFHYDQKGRIREYYFDNIFKGNSYIDGVALDCLQSDGLLDSFAEKYRLATTESQRLEVCISAITSGIISVGCSAKNIDRLFGTHWVERSVRTTGSNTTAVIDFVTNRNSFEDNASQMTNIEWLKKVRASGGRRNGWFIALVCGDVVGDYRLTNLADGIVE